MRTATCHLKSSSPYGQNGYIKSEKPRDVTHQDFEKQVWRERCTVDDIGNVVIPPMAFKNSLTKAASYKSIKIPGKGQQTFSKHFRSGVMVVDPTPIGVTSEEIDGHWQLVPANGKAGGSSKVEKCFPFVSQWEAKVQFLILDELITNEVFEEHIADCGRFIGIGFFRPENNGYWGRFSVECVDWS